MPKLYSILLVLISLSVSSQTATFTIHKKPAIKMVYSRSNSLYMGIANDVKIINVDSTSTQYWLAADYAVVKPLGYNRFAVFALRPSKITVRLYEKHLYDSIVVDSEQVWAKEPPSPHLALAGRVIDYAVSDSLLLNWKSLQVMYSDSDLSVMSHLHVASFLLRVSGRTYSSQTDGLTGEMINVLRTSIGQRVDFLNIQVVGNGNMENIPNVTGVILVK